MFPSHSGCAVLEGSDWGMGGGSSNELVCGLCINQNIIILSFRPSVRFLKSDQAADWVWCNQSCILLQLHHLHAFEYALSRFHLNRTPEVGSVLCIHVVLNDSQVQVQRVKTLHVWLVS